MGFMYLWYMIRPSQRYILWINRFELSFISIWFSKLVNGLNLQPKKIYTSAIIFTYILYTYMYTNLTIYIYTYTHQFLISASIFFTKAIKDRGWESDSINCLFGQIDFDDLTQLHTKI